jgi:hypothetical protein
MLGHEFLHPARIHRRESIRLKTSLALRMSSMLPIEMRA